MNPIYCFYRSHNRATKIRQTADNKYQYILIIRERRIEHILILAICFFVVFILSGDIRER